MQTLALALAVASLACSARYRNRYLGGKSSGPESLADVDLITVTTAGTPAQAKSMDPDVAGRKPAQFSPALPGDIGAERGSGRPAADIQRLGITPIAIALPQPHYPASARAKKLSGTVIIEIIVGETGTVIRTQVLDGEPPFVASALEAVRRWRYQPVIIGGRSVRWRSKVSLHFLLQRDEIILDDSADAPPVQIPDAPQ